MTLNELLARGADDDIAIRAPDRSPLTYGALRELCENTRRSLGQCDITPKSRVGIVAPNGPEMAASFVAVSSCATAAPLNPVYKDEEFEFYLSDLEAAALILPAADPSPARDVAKRLGIPIIDYDVKNQAPAGSFELAIDGLSSGASCPAPVSTDTALILHTSGTTSRPKMVPLSHENLCASARHIQASLGLSRDDVCLNIMPLFHIHGLIAAVLSSLGAGGSVYCTPGFNAMRFFSWLTESAPTWYTAVPTMHQTILARASRNADVVAAANLRFIRSSSSSLPPQVMQELEAVFGCPVIESYGMTEAAHQMTSNQLPPGSRKPGTVGVAAGPAVRLMDDHGRFVAEGEEGEIVIRGANVTTGYENNAEANEAAFPADPDGGKVWFRTGDLGVFDDEGFLTISGRLKEIINRGGEKIAPREVDDVLMDLPAIAQVVTFATAHEKLGEEVACAVVLHEGQSLSEEALKAYAAERLAAFKVPRTVLFVDEIPKGSTGKLQRIGLAEKLGL